MENEAAERVGEYFQEHNWKSTTAGDNIVYHKHRSPEKPKTFEFLSYPRKNSLLQVNDLVGALKKHFAEKGYKIAEPANVISRSSTGPFFISSGIQQYQEDFLRGVVPDTEALFTIQPVVRTNYMGSVGEGNVSSFVNPSSIKMPCDIETHLRGVDDWMSFLSSIGLYLGDFRITLKQKKPVETANPWTQNSGFVLSFDYGGLTLGDGGFISLASVPDKTISDIGFGLERILWAVNKQPKFGEVIGPLPEAFAPNYPHLDALRTTTLMAMSGLTTEGDGFNQFKKYLPSLTTSSSPCIHEGAKYFYSFWEKFVDPIRGRGETTELIEAQRNRSQNLALLNKLGLKKTPRQLEASLGNSVGMFCEELLKLKIVGLDVLRNSLAE